MIAWEMIRYKWGYVDRGGVHGWMISNMQVTDIYALTEVNLHDHGVLPVKRTI